MKQIFFIIFLFAGLHSFSQADSTISVVSLEKVNVVYRGIQNPIKVAVPGAKSFIVEAQGELKKIDSLGNYSWNVTAVIGTKAILRIKATMYDGSSISEEKEYQVSRINPIMVTIENKSHENLWKLSKEEIIDMTVNLKIDDFYPLQSFAIESIGILLPTNETIISEGNKLDKKAINTIKNLNVGDLLTITAYGGHNVKIISATIEIIKE